MFTVYKYQIMFQMQGPHPFIDMTCVPSWWSVREAYNPEPHIKRFIWIELIS